MENGSRSQRVRSEASLAISFASARCLRGIVAERLLISKCVERVLVDADNVRRKGVAFLVVGLVSLFDHPSLFLSPGRHSN